VFSFSVLAPRNLNDIDQPSWSAFYAPGHEIKSYFKRVAEKYNVDQYIKLSHRVTSAQYLADSGKWSLTVLNVLTGVSFSDTADFVLSTTGPLSRWNWPDIPGIHDFQGQLMHSAQYDSEMGRHELENGAERDKWLNKKIAVIGVGSSAIQIVPSLQKVCGKVTNFVRGKTCEFSRRDTMCQWGHRWPTTYRDRHTVSLELYCRESSGWGESQVHTGRDSALQR
jgi:cation diffusion facilitator CzcD-associated flavoprotein CzcO